MSKWAKIRNTNYSVSDSGDVRTDRTGRIKRCKQSKGYKSVSLYTDGIEHTYRVHRLVAEHFISNPDNKPCVNHKNGNKVDNEVSNLEWVTYSENMKHAYKTGLATRHPTYGMLGKKNPNGGRKGKSIICLTTNETFGSIIEAAKNFNISDTSICECLKGQRDAIRGLMFKYL